MAYSKKEVASIMKQKLLTTLLASTVLTLGPGCGAKDQSQGINPEASEPLAQRDHWQYDLEDIAESTVCIKAVVTYDGSNSLSKFGSGFVYGQDHDNFYLTTNAHVVDSPDEIKVVQNFFDPGTILKKVKEEFYIVDNSNDEKPEDDIKLELLVKTDEENDTAVLTTKVSQHVSRRYKLAPEFNLMRGDEVILVGYPLASGNYTTFGKVSSTDVDGYFALDLTVNPGNSGGVVFYKDGKGDLYLVGQLGMCLYRWPNCVGIGLGRPVKDLKEIWETKEDKMETKEDKKDTGSILENK